MTKSNVLQIRLTEEEKAAFVEASEISGLSLSSWARERLRHAVIRELEGAGRDVPFVTKVPIQVEQDD